MIADTPLISIITPCYNRADFIERCIASIPEHVRPWVEHIVIDGGSTDGTIEVLKRYAHIKWVSGPDKGIYDALNKGIRLATGKYVGFLSTDDFLDEQFFNLAAEHIAKFPLTDSISFDFKIHDRSEVKLKISCPLDEISIINGDVSLFSMLIRRETLVANTFNDSFKIAGDLELGLRVADVAEHKTHSTAVMLNFWRHDGSITGHSRAGRDREYDEVFRILKTKIIISTRDRKLFNLICARFLQIGRYFYNTGGINRFQGRYRILAMYSVCRLLRTIRIVQETEI